MSTVGRTLTPLPSGTWRLDPVHSQVGFAVDYVVGRFTGSFSPVEATLDVAEDGTAHLSGEAPVSGVRVQDETLEAMLKSPEFFDAERAPRIRFESSEIRRTGNAVAIEGELEIRGIAQRVAFDGEIGEPKVDAFGNTRLNLALQATIDRTRFGIDYNDTLPSGEPALGNEVTLSGELYLIKEEA
jgi:polyisoprenoid-binding protein YceI